MKMLYKVEEAILVAPLDQLSEDDALGNPKMEGLILLNLQVRNSVQKETMNIQDHTARKW